MNHLSAQLESQIDELKKLQQAVIAYEQAQRQQLYAGKITDLKAFGKMLNDKRKSLGIELSMLELQTGVSISTLNRLFQDPSQVRFTTVFLVAQTLGVSLCAIQSAWEGENIGLSKNVIIQKFIPEITQEKEKVERIYSQSFMPQSHIDCVLKNYRKRLALLNVLNEPELQHLKSILTALLGENKGTFQKSNVPYCDWIRM